MKKKSKLFLIIITLIFLSCSSDKEKIMEINGKVIDSNTKSILLVKPYQDMRFDSLIEIPVINGKFHYTEKIKNPEAVELFFGEVRQKGVGKYMPLFLENEKINLTIYPEKEFDKNIVEGGNLNTQYKKYLQEVKSLFDHRKKPLQDSLEILYKNNEYDSDKMKTLLYQLKNVKNKEESIIIYRQMEDLRKANEHMSPKAKVLNDQLKPIHNEYKQYQRKYIEENPTIVSYYFFLQDLKYKRYSDINSVKNTYQILSKANPNHPYNEWAHNMISAIENIKVGEKFIDFSAPDLNGKEVKLSDKIKGKVALLDLWATWCGSCIARTKTMIPIYNEYKDKGFTIVGVAGEFKNTDRLVKFLNKEKWEWLNLVELDRQNKIWEKYGIEGQGGEMFLIDENGIIIAKSPTAEEVRKVLETKLK